MFSRGGRASVYIFGNSFVEDLAGVAITTPGAFAPNEVAWTTPNNASKNIPGTYAIATLNGSAIPVTPGSQIAFTDADTGATAENLGTLTPTAPGTLAVWVGIAGLSPSFTPGTLQFSAAGGSIYTTSISAPTAFTSAFGAGLGYCAIGQLFGTTGGASVQQKVNGGQTGFPTGTTLSSGQMPLGVPASDAVILGFAGITPGGTVNLSVTDDQNNVYVQLGQVIKSAGTRLITALWICLAPKNGPRIFKITNNGTSFGASSVNFYALDILGIASSSLPRSQILQASNFNFNIPASASIIGVQVEVTGHQTTQPPDAILTAGLIPAGGTASPTSLTGQLQIVDTQTVIGSPTERWGLQLTPAMLNNPNFAVNVIASALGGEAQSFSIYAVKLKVWTSPAIPQNFNYVKTFEEFAGLAQFTLALDAAGILWQEDTLGNLGVLNSIFTGISPNTFAKSVTYSSREFLAFSDLLQGTDMPRQWDGTNLDRVSQCGPGAAPSFALTTSTSTVKSITQQTPALFPTDVHSFISVGAGPVHLGTPYSPGNVCSFQPNSTFRANPPFPTLKPGDNIVISGAPLLKGFNINNDPTGVTNPAYWTVTSIGPASTSFQTNDWFTFQVPFTAFFSVGAAFGDSLAGINIQPTVATLTTQQQVPFLEVGNQFTLTGVTPAGWNNAFSVLQTPNAAVLGITQTLLQANVAQYTFVLQSGTLPTVGQFVNVNGTLNGNGIFNVKNAAIISITPNSFSIQLPNAANISAAAENNANGSIYGTIFLFDPAGTVTPPIIGNAGAIGSIATSGVMGIGIRQAVVIFQTRNGALTAPSPFATFNITGATSAIVCTGIPTGPPDVVARIIAFTGAGGANFFWIPTPQTVVSNGQNITYSSTVINDNFTQQATLSFPDQLLLDASAIDIQGNNLFAQLELGSSRGFLTYADRLIAWGVQNKIQNLLNWSFDGGSGVQSAGSTAGQTYPLGWTIDSVNGAGGSVLTSPLFGNSFYIQNKTGNPQALYGMLTQPAYVNQVGTPIVTAATTYSCRVTARSPAGAASGNLVVDLFSPVLNQVFGSFAIPLATLTTNFQILSGTMLIAPFSSVPKDLVVRLYAQNIPNNGDVEVDRIEPFPTQQPSFSTQFFASYAFNQEAFDGRTGLFGPAQNQQRVNGGLVLFDTLYMLKENSWYSTSDNGLTEPNQWQWKTISDKAGTIGIHSYDYGEAWAVSACRAGLYLFEGGEPVKISQEIQTVWDLINWKFGHTIWVRNDEATKTIKIGVPIATPNIYMPEMPANANPTSPNVILSMSYRELNTGAQLAGTPPIRSSFSGRLLSPEPARKWSFWNIRCPYADSIDRGNNSKSLFYCSGYADSKIFELLGTQLSDDGLAINSFYLTHGMPRPEIAEARGIDVLRSQFDYLTLNISGAGNLQVLVFPEDPGNLPYVLDPPPLQAITQGDTEVTVNIKGQRYYIRIGTNAVGSKFSCSTITGVFSEDPWAPVRGTTSGSA